MLHNTLWGEEHLDFILGICFMINIFFCFVSPEKRKRMDLGGIVSLLALLSLNKVIKLYCFHPCFKLVSTHANVAS